MTGSERRQREMARRRQIIISTTRKLAENEGWSSVTTRRLADEIEYSQPVLYQHFKGRDEIVKAVALEGFGELTAIWREARLTASSPEEVLQVLAETYVEFATAKPRLYEAMFAMSLPLLFGRPESPDVLVDTFTELRECIFPLAGTRDVETLAEVFWASLHGLAILSQSGRLRPAHQRERLTMCVQQLTCTT